MAVAMPIIAAASALYSGYQQNKSRQKQDELMKQEQKMVAEKVQPQSDQYFKQSREAFGPSMSYYTSMMSNPREATAPEQNRINGLYAGQANNTRNMYPRGSFGPNAAEAMRSQQRQATEGVIQSGRPMAANALSGLGSTLGQLGMQGYGLGSGLLGNVFNQGLQARQQAYNVGAGSGNALFNSYQQYLMNRSTSGPEDQSGGGGGGGLSGGGAGATGTNTNTGGAASWGLA